MISRNTGLVALALAARALIEMGDWDSTIPEPKREEVKHIMMNISAEGLKCICVSVTEQMPVLNRKQLLGNSPSCRGTATET